MSILDAVFIACFFTAFGIGIGLMAACWKSKPEERKRLDVRV